MRWVVRQGLRWVMEAETEVGGEAGTEVGVGGRVHCSMCDRSSTTRSVSTKTERKRSQDSASNSLTSWPSHSTSGWCSFHYERPRSCNGKGGVWW